jgi:hypothetical protein
MISTTHLDNRWDLYAAQQEMINDIETSGQMHNQNGLLRMMSTVNTHPSAAVAMDLV